MPEKDRRNVLITRLWFETYSEYHSKTSSISEHTFGYKQLSTICFKRKGI